MSDSENSGKLNRRALAARRGFSRRRCRGADALRAPVGGQRRFRPGVFARPVRAARAGRRRDDSALRHARRARCRRAGVRAPDARRMGLARNPRADPRRPGRHREARLASFRRAIPGIARRAPAGRAAHRRRRIAGAPGPGLRQIQMAGAASVTTNRKPARRRSCVTSSCPARGAPVCRWPKSAAPPPSEPAGISMDFDAIVVGSGSAVAGWPRSCASAA